MENIHKLIVLAAGLILTCVVILAGITLTGTGEQVTKSMSNAITTRNSSIEESQYTQYCNGYSTGSDVVSAIRKYKDDLTINVQIYTSTSGTTTMNNSDFGTTFQNLPTNSKYINPAASFSCELVRSANGVIVGMNFKQAKYVSLATSTSPISTLSMGSDTVSYSSESDMLAAYSDAAMMTEEEATAFSSSGGLDIIYSDGDENSQNTAESSVIENIANTIYDYSSQLDDIVRLIDSIDLDSGDIKSLQSATKGLETLYSNLDFTKGQCDTETLGKAKSKELTNNIENIQEKIIEAKEYVKELEKKMKEKLDSEKKWYVGYPVKEDVKVVLEDGILTFSGSGDINTGHDLPKWLNQAEKIKEVVFKEGVTPTIVDFWFAECNKLKKVSGFPETVVSANGTFQGCDNLTKVNLNDQIASANGIAEGTSIIFNVKDGSITQETLKELSKLPDSKFTVEVRK